MNNGKDQGGSVDISGVIGSVGGDIIAGSKIIVNIVNPIGRIVQAETPPGPNIYVDRKHEFSISWPKDSDWIPSSTMGAYQLSELGVTTSQERSSLFGLVRTEQATFAVFKILRPQDTCIGWVFVESLTPLFMTPMRESVKFVGAMLIKFVIAGGGVITSQNVLNESTPTILYRQSNDLNVIVKIFPGKRYVHWVRSPIYPAESSFDKAREDTNAILNSFQIV